MKMKEGDENDHQKALDGINKDWMKIVEMHKKKKEIADNMENLISRYERKLDSDILKCKRELEEENPGVTEVIENRVNNPETPLKQAPKKRPSKKPRGKNRFPVKVKQEVEQPERILTQSNGNNHAEFKTPLTSSQQGVNHQNVKKSHPGGKPVDYQNYLSVKVKQEPGLGDDLNNSEYNYNTSRPPRTKTKTPKAAAWEQGKRKSKNKRKRKHSSLENSEEDSSSDEEEVVVRQAKNEEKFCKCNQVSYGNMIACDAEGCPIQWFHYGCVGISEAPTGEWFCPDCRVGKLDDTIKEENHLDY